MKALELILLDKNTILENAIASLGEIPEEQSRKIDYVFRMHKWPDLNIERLGCEIKTLQAQLKQYKIFKEKVDEYLKLEASGEGICEIQGAEFKANFSESQGSLDIYDESLLPPELIEQVITSTPNNKRIKAMLELGHEIPGARLVKGYRLSITPIKKD